MLHLFDGRTDFVRDGIERGSARSIVVVVVMLCFLQGRGQDGRWPVYFGLCEFRGMGADDIGNGWSGGWAAGFGDDGILTPV